MEKLIDLSNIDIAVIGESMAGKTTWITSMFDESVNVQLRQKCLENTEGQTKIKTFYKLRITGKKEIVVEEIVINVENYNKKISEVKKSFDEFNLNGVIADEIKGNDECNEDASISIDLSKMKINIETFFEKIINDRNVANSGIVSQVVVSGPADKDVRENMENLNIETITIRDTRGLMDETADFNEKNAQRQGNEQRKEGESILETLENENQKIINKLLNERGVLNADGCVFVTAGGNALNKGEAKERYGFLFEKIVKSMPTFLVARSSVLNDHIGTDFSASQYKEWMQVDSTYKFEGECKKEHTCDAYVNLLKEYGLFEKSKNLRSQVMKKHYKQLLVPLFDLCEQEEIKGYLTAAHASFNLIVKELREYKEEVYKLFETEDQLVEKLKCIYKDRFKKLYYEQYYRYMNREYTMEVASAWCAPSFRGKGGTMVGPRGGLTTRIAYYGYVGKYAISLLESSYKLFERIIDSLDNEDKVPEDIKIKVMDWLRIVLKKNSAWYSVTDNMICTRFLETVWINTNSGERAKNLQELQKKDYPLALSIVGQIMEAVIIGVLDSAESMKNQANIF